MIPEKRKRLSENCRDCYWPHLVVNCATGLTLQVLIKDSARFEWHTVAKVAHCYQSVSATSQRMQASRRQL